ncbi:hypothetical protein D3C72_1534410 [compost metagenome]
MLVVAEHRDHHALARGIAFARLAYHRDAAAVRQAQVAQQHIGLVQRQPGKRVGDAAGAAGHGAGGRMHLDGLHQAALRRRVILDDQDSGCGCHASVVAGPGRCVGATGCRRILTYPPGSRAWLGPVFRVNTSAAAARLHQPYP